MKLFLDACIVIYWVEAADPFYSRVMETIHEIEKKHPRLIHAVSRLSLLECLVKPMREQDKEKIARYGEFFQAPDLSIVELSPQVIDLATRLRADTGLRTPDAIQAACALSLRGAVIFVTGDESFKKVPGLDVVLV